ncbi:LPD7 domain-containing protein [Aliivibrio salmonicida]|uniref:LPD7 domain-containing protein n=1 Tax=Aliivibrio salmonicida TaxID=40269 RepID=UPI003D117370
MLIRANGGRSGIGDYLREGIKNGREHTRDELDQRIVLEGNLHATELIISTMNPEAQRYLHITLSFKEDHIDNDVMNNIVTEFKSFAMKAYHEDEYDFYAEAHVPKIKSLTDKKTNALIERKPHIHVVIPEHNLVTNKRLEPFGRVELNTKYIDAFQETMNEKYGLASPKMNIRSDFTDESTVIERSKGDSFKGSNKAIKEAVLEHVMALPPSTLTDLSQHLAEQGYEVKVRNKGKDNSYLNIKAQGESKGINLKDTVFTERFLSLPTDQKQEHLSDNTSHDYVAPDNNARYQATEKHHSDLVVWNEQRAHEVRHITRRNRAAYKGMTTQEKTAFINQKKKDVLDDTTTVPIRTQRDCVADINRNLDAANRHLLDAKRHCGGIESGARNIAYRRDLQSLRAVIQRYTGHQEPPWTPPERATGHNCVIQQIKSDIQESDSKKRLAPDIAHIKQQLNASNLLRDLSQSHGLVPQKYTITQGKEGGDRIACGTRNLNVADFLTKEMGLSWKEAKQQLEQSYERQHDPTFTPSTEHDRTHFTEQWQPSHKIERKQAWKAQYRNEKTQRFSINHSFKTEKNAIYADSTLSKTDRNIALSISRMNKIIADMEHIEHRQWDREQLKQHYPDLVTAQYQRFEQRHIPTESLLMKNTTQGIIEEHGAAPYEFNSQNKANYYVKLTLPDNQSKTVWGLGLKEAIEKTAVKTGQSISLTNVGKDINTTRNNWEITQIKETQSSIKEDIKQAISLSDEAIKLEKKGFEIQAGDKQFDAVMIMYSITKHSKNNPFDEQTHPFLHRTFIKVNSEQTIPLEKNQPELIETSLLNKRILLDKNLEASRLLIMYPKLKELGINAESISKTERGDRINFNDKSLTISKLMKETLQYKTEQIVAELTPIYSAQENDKQRVEHYLNDPTNKLATNKESPIELTIQSPQKEKETPQVNNINTEEERKKAQTKRPPLPPQKYDNITHKTDDKGHVTYAMDKKTIVVDRGDNVHIAQNSDKAIEIGLRLSMEKFGKTLDVRGTNEYKEKVAEVAVKNKLSIQFSDPKMNELMKEKEQQFKNAENVVQKAERDYKQESEPQKAPEMNKQKSHGFER